MTSQIVLIFYVVVGAGASIAILVNKSDNGPLRGPTGALLMFALWPFLLPACFLGERTVPSPGPSGSEGQERIDAAARAIRRAWDRTPTRSARERELSEEFIRALRKKQERLADVEETLASAPRAVRPRLVMLRDDLKKEIDEGIRLLDDMVGQLTLLRFAEISQTEGEQEERARVEDLLVRIEAMVDLGEAA